MNRSRVAIELSPSRLEVAVLRGRKVARAAAVRIHCPDWEPRWPAALDSMKKELADLVTGLGASGATATVLLSGPTAAVNVHSCPARAGSAAACSAAILALGNNFVGPIEESARAVLPLLRDRAAAGANDKPMRHVLAFADSEPTAQAVARWIESAGLRFGGLIPLDAVEALAAVHAATSTGDRADVRASLWIGEHHSVLAVGTPGHLRFVRSIALGTESLVDALTRPIVRRGAPSGGDGITLSREQGRSLLMRAGIPEISQIIDEERGLDGGAILPLLQPTLQRFSLEVKQSLRFGLTESERNGAMLSILGAGRLCPGLEANLRGHLAAQDSRPQAASESPPASGGEYVSSTHGAVHAMTAFRDAPPLLMPRARGDSLTLRRVRVALRLGIAACLALVALDGILAWNEVLQSSVGDAEVSATQVDALVAARDAESMLASAVRARVGAFPALGPWLAEVSRAATGRVSLASVAMEQAEGEFAARIKGFAPTAPSETRGGLREFIDEVSACPLVRNASLRHTQRSAGEHADEQAFEIAVTFVELPISAARTDAGPASEETPR